MSYQIDDGVEFRPDDLVDEGLEHLASGHAAQAVGLFEQVIATQPDHAEALHGLIRALVDSGRSDDALKMTIRLIENDPDDVLAVTRLSMIYQQMGMIPEAEAAAARAKILGWKMELRGGSAAKTDL